jgi:hypothetical protein
MSRSIQAGILALVVLAVTAVSAQANPAHWVSRQDFAGNSMNYAPQFIDPGSSCWYNASLNAYWMQMPGPTVEAPGVNDNNYAQPGTFDINIAGGYSDPSSAGVLEGQQPSETIQYIPEVQFPNGTWNFPRATNGDYQWMEARDYATPGAGSADASWLFWRNHEWEVPQVGSLDDSPLAGYGSNWEWDSMFLPGAGTYGIGGVVYWYPYNDSAGNTVFPGEVGVEQGDYTIGCSGGAVASIVSGSHPMSKAQIKKHWVSAPTQQALTAKLMRASNHNKIGYHVVVARHTHARSGRKLVATMLASNKALHPFRNIIKKGKVVCRAKIGKRLGPRNHHKLLRHYKPKKIQTWHHRNGVAACIWKVPKHTKGLRITYSVQVKYAGHAATLVDTHRILPHRR